MTRKHPRISHPSGGAPVPLTFSAHGVAEPYTQIEAILSADNGDYFVIAQTEPILVGIGDAARPFWTLRFQLPGMGPYTLRIHHKDDSTLFDKMSFNARRSDRNLSITYPAADGSSIMCPNFTAYGTATANAQWVKCQLDSGSWTQVSVDPQFNWSCSFFNVPTSPPSHTLQIIDSLNPTPVKTTFTVRDGPACNAY